ncbi:hypothetical protein C8R42DRAFT_648338 [Lentinula raphanica]|nr:hypothetical protein C8R42DRAFT_648338 [Lentinula raphanica]
MNDTPLETLHHHPREHQLGDLMIKHSKVFNAADADIVILSSDNVQFRLHRKRLELSSGLFPLAAELPETSSKEVVRLTESGKTLDLLFQFMYPQRYPSLSGLKVDQLLALAEAAEKYEVFALMNICELHLRALLPKYSQRVLKFAAKHDHDALIQEVAPLLVSNMPLSELAGVLPPRVYKPWSLYRERWVHKAVINIAHVGPHDCYDVRTNKLTLHQSLLSAPFNHNDPKFWEDLTKIYPRNCCHILIKKVQTLLEKIVDNITPLQLPNPAAATEN